MTLKQHDRTTGTAIAITLLPLLLPSLASAERPPTPSRSYISLAVGASNFIDDDKYVDFDLDRYDVGWSLFGGYRFLNYIAVEAGYTDFGSFQARDDQAKIEERYSSLYLAAVGTLPLRSNWQLYGKLGAGALRQEQSFSFQANDTTTHPAIVLGIGTLWAPAALEHWAFTVGFDSYSFETQQAGNNYWNSVGLTSASARYFF